MNLIGEDYSKPRFTKRIAAIDLGTNSFHVVIADLYSDGSFRRVDDLKEMVELAKDGIGKGLSKSAFERGIEALRRIKILIDSFEVDTTLAYATSAIREAENGGEFIQTVIDEIGIKINAIPGIVEAELIGYAVQHGLKLSSDPVLGVDIGGGSVEFIVMNATEIHELFSKKVGVSRMTDLIQPKDPITSQNIDSLEAYYEQELGILDEKLSDYAIDTVIGSSGTMQAIGLMVAAQKGLSVDVTLNELSFSAQDFFKFYEFFISLSREERMNVQGMDSKRVDFINTGVVLVNFLMKRFQFKTIKISTQALREGIIIRYLKNEMVGLPKYEEFQDPRKRSVFELLRKCNWHEAHSRQVAWMALQLFDHLNDVLELSSNDRELLEYAAFMHDIGYHISHRAHHKHALYLIRNADLKGFSQDEIEIMANVSRYHRRSTPNKRHAEYAILEKPIRDRIKKLAAILRVADGLDRSHYQNVQQLFIQVLDSQIDIKIKSIDVPHLEIWGAKRKSHLLSDLTNRKVSITHLN